MADEIDDIESSEGVAAPKKKRGGAVAPGLMRVLSGILAAIVAIIFMVLTSVVTFRLMNGNRIQHPAGIMSEVYNQTPDFDVTEPMEIRGRTSDRIPITFSVQVVLGYDPGDDRTASEIARKNSQLRDLMRGFFSSKRAEELMPVNEERVKAELQQRINRILSQGRVKTVLFTEFLIDS